MSSSIIVAVISFLGTLIGTAGGIVASAKLTEYRLTQLERKLENISAATSKIPVMEEKQKSSERRISKLERDYSRAPFISMN